MVVILEESKSVPYGTESYELWSHRGSGAFYAVRLHKGRVTGAFRLVSSAALANRHSRPEEQLDPVLGADLEARRCEYAVIEQW